MLKVSDDSGFLAVLDPAAYRGFVGEACESKQLLNAFRSEMKRNTLLIWGTGLEGLWNVEVTLKRSLARGYRDISGPLVVTRGNILVTNYQSLSTVANNSDVRLPQKHETNHLVSVPNGQYRCRVIQCFNPKKYEPADPAEPARADFVIELTYARTLARSLRGIPWLIKGL